MTARTVLLAVLAAYGTYFAVTAYADRNGPQPLGASIRVAPDGLAVDDVRPESIAWHSGLRSGDLLTRVGDYPARSVLAWTIALARITPEQPLPVVVSRHGVEQPLLVRFGRRDADYWRTPSHALLIVERSIQLITLVVAVLLACRATTPTAVVGSMFLAAVGAFSTTMPPGFAAYWSTLPGPVAVALFLPHLSIVSIGGMLFVFCATLAGRPLRRAFVIVLSAPWVVFLTWEIWFLTRVVYDPSGAPIERHSVPMIVALNAAYVLMGVVALWRNYGRLSDLTQRRRVRIVVAGTIVGTLFGAPAVITLWLGSDGGPSALFEPPLTLQLAYTAFLIVPVSLWWAIARHRLYDVSFVMRRSLQYVLANRGLRVTRPLIVAATAAELWTHHQQPLAETLHSHGLAYAGIAFGLVAFTRKRADWLDALDRRFFRDRYDACQVLRAIARVARRTHFRSAANFVVDEVQRALHLEWAALLVLDTDGYHVWAGTTPTRRPWPTSLTVLAFAESVTHPVEIDLRPTSWFRKNAAADEIAFLDREQARLIVPVLSTDNSPVALVALGAKLSEEPFSSEDKELLMGIAETLGERVERGDEVVFPVLASVAAEGDRTALPVVHAAPSNRSDGRFDLPPRLEGGRPGEGDRWAELHLLDYVGGGAVGTVWRAWYPALRLVVAAKLLRDDRDDKEQLLTEARRLARITHRSVVRVFGATEYDGVAGFWMEFVEGETLASRLKHQGRFSPRDVTAIGTTVCSALTAIHDTDLVHQDVKPQNVMREDRDNGKVRYVLMDLGASVDIDAAEPPRWGTPAYTAPEVLFGERATPASDIYSVGVLMFELLTGQLPVHGDDADAMRQAHRRRERLRLDDARPHLPEALVQTVEQALAAAPERRFATAGQLADALRQVAI